MFVYLVFGVMFLDGIICDHQIFHVPLESRNEFAAPIFNLAAILIELALVSTMPMESHIKEQEIVVSHAVNLSICIQSVKYPHPHPN